MNRAGKQFLARAALAQQEHGCLAGGGFPGFADDPAHRGALPRHQVIAPGELAGEQLHLRLEPRSFQSLLHHHGEMLRVEWLGNKIVRAAFDRFDRPLNGAVGGDEDDRK